MTGSFIDTYKSQHQHPVNKLCHVIGIPLITISWLLFFFNWRWALALFVVGWILQFVGHAIEGNRPAFFQNPVYFLVAPRKQLAFCTHLLQNSSVAEAGQETVGKKCRRHEMFIDKKRS